MATRRRNSKYFLQTTVTATDMEDFSPEFADACKRWALRALIDLGGHEGIVQSSFCTEPGLMRALGLNQEMIENYEPERMLGALKQLHRDVVNPKTADESGSAAAAAKTLCTPDSVLMRNIDWLGNQVSLTSDEKQILLLSVLVRQNPFLGQAVEALGFLSTSRANSVLSVLLDISVPRVLQALSEDSSLVRSGLMFIDDSGNFEFNNKVVMLTGLDGQLMVEQKNLYFLFAYNFVVAPKPKLTLEQFDHLGSKVKNLSTFLSVAVAEKQKGVNILVYGPPGTGKTELGRALAKELKFQLFEVAVEGWRGSHIAGKDRLAGYRLSQMILAKRKNTMLVFDEIEDITPRTEDDGNSRRGNRSGQKGFLNQLLQENPVPTIWITNSLRPLDPAHLRRFDYCLLMDIPPKKVRTAMLADCTKGLDVSLEWCEKKAANDALSPAGMSRAAKVAGAMFKGGANTSVEALLDDVIDSAMKVLSIDAPPAKAKAGAVKYQLDALNADCDLGDVLAGLTETGEGRICLYGVPGTGKSAFAKYVADVLGKPALIKRASDILDPYIGQTECNMAEMFYQAEKDDAVLILDEADSFLRSREGARRGWEITAVNEMLTQMEAFGGIFFATTNLLDQLDAASLRRFDMKINFGFLKHAQRLSLCREVCKSIGLEMSSRDESRLVELEKLTPGDFENALRQSRLRPLRTVDDLLSRLSQEVKLKNLSSGRPIGFLATGTA
ncbi:SpoVK/Ycf46/Vps4 family AAA+-type ATPase [Jezberella montanilacus]|jgi:SpoVK/Ycf46/Vps4 family AAA+-type ATPase|uniref:SpoVK/Ycf46/Vps4 family AAA+-type ATPase n=1 Tax=Jezberella montanilacus TaxID=323426 RepID=A0A2T0XBZ9_9BURK|nr:ATP-binding protein [Jezberella montanilacus]PRY96452.1 SpoVK/Ycf46/Vps4 family AAA+-type ATPase [Jezberella montanilacus]